MKPQVYTGIALPSHKLARDKAIVPATVPDELILLLDQHGPASLQPCVEVGATLRLGQVIATAATALGTPLHAPVSGRVHAIELRDASKVDRKQSLAIIITNDHLDTTEPVTLQQDWSTWPAQRLCEHLAQGGIVGLGGAAFPTAIKLTQRQQIDCLLINGVECEPFICCDDRLMRERALQVLQGVQILLKAAQAEHAKLAIEADKPEALAAMRAALQTLDDARMEIQIIPSAYPSGDEGRLITQLLGREIPRGGLPADIGVLVHNVATAYACAQWLLQGRPLLSRIVTVTGPGVVRPGNMEVRLGTPIDSVLADCGGILPEVDTLIAGGAMMGRTLSNMQQPIVKGTNCLIAARHTTLQAMPAELPCIRCGECAMACPAYLLPQQLLLHARQQNPQALAQLGLPDCIECGCCDYVCPSHISLAARFRAAKPLLTSAAS